MPAYILFSTLILMPIRLYGFVRCGHLGSWGTRANAYTAGDPLAGPEAATMPSPSTGGSTQVLTRPQKAATPERTDGDPRALIPYLIATAVIVIGVMYDVRAL
jgi:hyaluronan synthase